MSDTDSFINEVTEEVRRDRINRFARKYGWIAALLILLAVGAAGFVEWRKARTQATAQDLGDAIYAALERESVDSRALALSEIEADGAAAAIVAMLAASEIAGRDPQDALAQLEEVAQRDDVPPIYRETAILKQTMIPDVPLYSEEKLTRLEPLTAPGAPLRLLALEQMALVYLERNEPDAAARAARQVVNAAEASAAQRERAGQILVVLGESPGETDMPETQ